jgi:hypothetical protein
MSMRSETVAIEHIQVVVVEVACLEWTVVKQIECLTDIRLLLKMVKTRGSGTMTRKGTIPDIMASPRCLLITRS